MALATLTIDLVTQLARFEADMGRAARAAETAAQRMDRAFTGVGAVFTGSLLANAAAQAVSQLSRLVPELVNSVARFQDLEEITGASAVALASFQTAADVSGTSTDQLAGFMVKLTGTLSKTNDETKGAGGALRALGLDMEKFRALAPEEQFETLAERLGEFRDGAGKTALAIALFGKSGAQLLPFLKELAETGRSQIRISAEQIRLADDLADRQARLRSELKQAASLVAIQMLPAFTELTKVFADAARGALGLDSSLNDLAGNSGIRTFAEGVAEGFATIADAAAFATKAIQLAAGTAPVARANADALKIIVSDPQASAEFAKFGTGKLKDVYDERARLVTEQEKRLRDLLKGDDFAITNTLRSRFAATRLGEQAGLNDIAKTFGGGKDARPELPFKGPADAANNKAARDADQARRALFEQNLRAIEALFASERDAVQFQQRFLDAEQQAGLVSLDAYYAGRQALDRRALELELKGYDERIEALRAYNATLKPGSDERIKGETRVADEEAKAARARQEYAQQAQLDALAQQRAYEQLADRVRNFKIELLDLQGDSAGAAALRAEQAIDNARRSSTALGLSADDVARFERATNASLRLAEAQRQVQAITERASIEEQRFLIAAEAAGASRTDVEQGLFRIRAQGLAQLAEQLRLAEEIARAASPDSPAVQFAQQLRLEFERLNAAVDPALTRLRQVGDEVADALGQAAGAIALDFRDARSAVQSLGDALLKISTRELIEKPFSDFFRGQIRQISEGSGGIGEAIRGVFGVGGGQPAAAPGAGFSLPANVFSAPEGLVATPGRFDGSFGGFLRGAFGGGGNDFQPAPRLGGGGGSAAPAGAFDLGGVLDSLGGLGSAADGSASALGGLAELPATFALQAFTQAVLQATAALGAIAAAGGPGAAGSAGQAAGTSLLASLTGGKGSSGSLDFIGNSFIKLFGLSEGGPTGPGGKHEPAGIVHKGEVVWSQDDVRGAGGVEVVDSLRRQARGGLKLADLPGFAEGGIAGRRSSAVQTSAPRSGSRGGNTINHVDLRGLTVDSHGAMDRMGEARSARNIARTAERYLSRRGA